ncbi:Protein CBG21665 [Caenorhabditis briggsae]|uniref:Protein CBG21665 n=1 Tax=Caenorhabditis briggsae TaxID=6238 RepID=A8Y0T1_CAEBR|nr:Protein CBG21665 [Caenorhabditis briggsae]CAP38501.1 Protein CBG21665 [Caenorhabditis briggsae]
MYEHWSDSITVGFDYTVGFISFVANLILIYIILKYTPESTKTYASIILAITISDCLSFCGTFMTSVRVLPRRDKLIYIFRGLCKYCFKDDLEFRAKFCLIWYAQHTQFYILNHIILIFSYVYRMLIITNPLKQIDRRTLVYSILLLYCPLHFCYFNWAAYMALQPMELVSKEIAKFEPDIVYSNATYYAIINLSDPSQIVFHILSVSSASVAILVTLLCRWRVIAFTRKYQQSEALKKLHNSLELVFSCQAIGPLMSSIASLLYMLVEFGSSGGTMILLENLIGKPSVIMYIVNPIVTVIFITPYKMVVLRWFRSVFAIYPDAPVLIDLSRSATGTS